MFKKYQLGTIGVPIGYQPGTESGGYRAVSLQSVAMLKAAGAPTKWSPLRNMAAARLLDTGPEAVDRLEWSLVAALKGGPVPAHERGRRSSCCRLRSCGT